MKAAVIAETEKIQFQRLAFHHLFTGDIGNVNCGKVRLPGNRAEAGEFGTVEFYEIVVLRMFVRKCL